MPFKVGTSGPHTVLPTSLVVVWIKSLATEVQCSFCSISRSHGMNFTMTRFMPRSYVKILDTVGFGISRSASKSRTVSHRSLLIAAHTWSTFLGVMLVAGLPECGSLSTDSWPSLKHLCHSYLCFTHCIIPESLLNHPNSFCRGMFQLKVKFDADSLLYLLSPCECSGHAVHMLTQQHLPPPLTVTVKSSLFMHVHSSPLSLAARLHQCCTNCSCYVNNGWTLLKITTSTSIINH